MLEGDDGVDMLLGGPGNDTLTDYLEGVTFIGGDGDDTIRANEGYFGYSFSQERE